MAFVPLLALLLQSSILHTNAHPAFTYRVPDPFVEFPEGTAASQDIINCWKEVIPSFGARAPIVLCIKRMGGVLARDTIVAAELPEGSERRTFKWGAFTLQGVRAEEEREGGKAFVLVAEVPLRTEAIQVVYAGPANREDYGEVLMQYTLNTLSGQSNWLTREQRAERMGKAIGTWF
jgi:hypothetical protein